MSKTMTRFFTTLLATVVATVSFAAPASEEVWLAEAWRRLDAETFAPQDRTACERRLRGDRGGDYALLLCTHLQRDLGMPEKAMSIAAGYFLPQEELPAWLQKKVLPDRTRWNISSETAPLAVLGARELSRQGRGTEVLQLLDEIGRKADGVGRALAAEGACDAFAASRMHREALRMLELGLQFVTAWRKANETDLAAGNQPLNSAILAGVERRLQARRVDLQHQLDIEAYGAEWLLFRAAEQRRLDSKLLQAALDYRQLMEMAPETMYGDAAWCGLVKTHLALSEETARAIMAAELDTQAQRVKAAKDRLEWYRQAKAAPERLAELQAWHQATVSNQTAMAAFKTGKAALAEAQNQLEAFIKKNEFGLYRGEALLAMGNTLLEGHLDAPQAIVYYRRCCDWLLGAFKLDKELQAFPMPEKSAKVAAPPKTMRRTDVWGNVDWFKETPGMLLNRRTAPWYLGYLRVMTGMKLSLAYFINGQRKEAIDELWVIPEYDAMEKQWMNSNMPNSHARLKHGYETGALFARPEDMAAFSGKSKVKLLIADFYFEIEQWAEAKRHYEELRAGWYDRLGAKGQAYLDLVQAQCVLITEGREAAFPWFERFETRHKKTPSWPRAMLTYASYFENDPATHEKADAIKWAIYNFDPKSDLGQRTLISIGRVLYQRGEHAEAMRHFQRCRKEAPFYAPAIDHYLAECENALKIPVAP